MSAPVDVLWLKAERLTAVVVSGMIVEAAYQGESVTASDIADCISADPWGETACYFRRNASDAVDLLAKFESDPELLALFSEAGHV